MIKFLQRKLWKNKWMFLCLVIGNLLLVSIVAATPLYINGTMRRILHQDMRQFQIENETYPALMSLQFTFNNTSTATRINTYLDALNTFAPSLVTEMEVPALRTIRQDTMFAWHLLPYVQRDANPRPRITHLTGLSGMEENVTITHGRLPSRELVNGNTIEAIITEQALLSNNLLLNELMEVSNVGFSPDTGPSLFVKLVGMYELAEGSDHYWSISRLDHHTSHILMSDDLILRHFIFNYQTDYRITTTWFHLLDYRQMTPSMVPHYIETLAYHNERFGYVGSRQVFNFYENFSPILAGHTEQAGPLAVTLWVLQVPIYVMLAFYIYMVSRQILKLEQNEISIIKSRGASRGQILGLYVMQGLIIAAISYPGGIFLGRFIAMMLGASSGFLDLVSRGAIIVDITPQALLYAGVAVFVSFLTMFLPVIKFSKLGIVDHKRTVAKKPLWQKFFLDILCLGVAIYALYNFNNQPVSPQDIQSVDPLLLLSSSLFILGLGLFSLRIFPYIVGLIFRLGKSFWRPSTYASLLKVMRSGGEEQFIMVFLLFTLSIGIFSAQAARSINLNSDHQIQYLAGADLTFQEAWRSIDPTSMHGESIGATSFIFFEPDFERFTHFEEVDALTRVKVENVDIRQTGDLPPMYDVQLMGIETDTFGDTIWFRGDLLPVHINHFLNAMASRSDGILLSSSFMGQVEIGDILHFSDHFGGVARGTVMGFVDHFPGFSPVQAVEVDGQMVEIYQPLIVANLGHLQSVWGIRPYQVWMRTNTDSNHFFYDFVEENRIPITYFNDAKNDLIENRSNPILQGTNGVLTVSFIVTLLICFTGFLIYWILSIKSRVLQFGIFRAMGMSMRSLVSLLINEQLFITFTAIGLGAVVGEVSARLFVPLIQMSYSAADQVIPLLIVTYAQDYINLYAVIGIMIIICLFVLGIYISKIKVAQALKLGED